MLPNKKEVAQLDQDTNVRNAFLDSFCSLLLSAEGEAGTFGDTPGVPKSVHFHEFHFFFTFYYATRKWWDRVTHLNLPT